MLAYLTFMCAVLAAVFGTWAWANTEQIKTTQAWLVHLWTEGTHGPSGKVVRLKRKD